MNTKHTQTPWELVADPAHFDTRSTIISGRPQPPSGLPRLVIQVGGSSDWREQEANARLVAAAPELLGALGEAERELQACQSVIHLSGGFDPAYVSGAQAALKSARAAINKATTEAVCRIGEGGVA